MQKSPLILAPSGDTHAAAVNWGLLASGVAPIWSSSLLADAVGPLSIALEEGDRGVGMDLAGTQVGPVWHRRPRVPQQVAHASPCDQDFLRGEWSLFQSNVFALAEASSDALWVNRPEAAVRTENKLVQLDAARRCDVAFPATLVSNDPREVRRFLAHHRSVVHKTFIPHTWKDGASGRLFSVAVTVLNAEADIDDASIALCPGIYQKYVEKVADLRVTMIGERFFAVRLRSVDGGAFVDWRPHTLMADLLAETYVLPEAYARKLARLMRELGIVFGCIDLAEDADGALHFLEVNQSGQFLFVEDLLESQPLLKAMCAMLAQGRTDYSLDAMPDISYKQWRASENFQAWQEQHREAWEKGWIVTAE